MQPALRNEKSTIDAKPIKRTAMGRFKHEAVAIKELDDGRIAAYMGDDQRFDYCYKFVSDRRWRDAIDDQESPLDEGSLFVAKFNDDGTGEWMELTIDNPVELERRINQIAGVVTNGLFAQRGADVLLLGGEQGVRTLKP